jgi:hypothetical protein
LLKGKILLKFRLIASIAFNDDAAPAPGGGQLASAVEVHVLPGLKQRSRLFGAYPVSEPPITAITGIK